MFCVCVCVHENTPLSISKLQYNATREHQKTNEYTHSGINGLHNRYLPPPLRRDTIREKKRERERIKKRALFAPLEKKNQQRKNTHKKYKKRVYSLYSTIYIAQQLNNIIRHSKHNGCQENNFIYDALCFFHSLSLTFHYRRHKNILCHIVFNGLSL